MATLEPGVRELTLDFHAPDPSPEPARPPLAMGHYTVHAEDRAHTCVATGGFDVGP